MMTQIAGRERDEKKPNLRKSEVLNPWLRRVMGLKVRNAQRKSEGKAKCESCDGETLKIEN